MSWSIVTGVCGTMTKVAVTAALIAVVPGIAGPAVATASVAGAFRTDAPTGPDDPECIQMPTDPVCEGGPYWQGPPPPPALPTGPLDPQCATMPADAACLGSPFVPPPPPPPPVEAAPPPPPVEEPIAPPPIEAPPPIQMPIAPPPMEAPPPIQMPIAPPPMAMPSPAMGGMPGQI
jgi:hypothetical protein